MGVFRNKNVRNQFILSLFFLLLQGLLPLFLTERQESLYSFPEQVCVFCRLFSQKKDIKKSVFYPSS